MPIHTRPTAAVVFVTDRYLSLPVGERTGQTLLVFTLPVVSRTRSGEAPAMPSSGGRVHWHRFRRAGDDPFSGSSVYACAALRCRPSGSLTASCT